MKIEIPEIIKEFKNINSEKLLNPDFGSKNFNSIKTSFEDTFGIIDEMVEISYEQEFFPEKLRKQITTIVTQFVDFYNRILSYSIDKDGSQQFREHRTIIQQFNKWNDENYQGFDSNNKPKNFLTIYNAAKNFSKKSNEKEQKLLKSYLSDARKGKIDIDTILNELRKKASSETVIDYANIFKEQAEKYSSYTLRLNPWKNRILKIGAAQKWLIIAILLGSILIFAIKYLTKIFPLETNDPIEIKIIQLITRFAFISFLIFLVTFCFKQYSICKHLYTINKHRQNTLDSYKLFLESVNREDTMTRNALMMEVAKAIYDSGNTGYLSSKKQESSPSIIEMTRLIKDQN